MSINQEQAPLQVTAFELPTSRFLGEEARRVLAHQAREAEALAKVCPLQHTTLASEQETVAFRDCYEKRYFPPLIARHRAQYDVDIKSEKIAGVATDVVTPASGVSADKRTHVLINLHGGGFIFGGRWAGQVESIPIAAVGQIKVVSVDYRMAPQHRYPAATDDVLRVYQALLQQCRPESIGIYGCSAGALLTAQVVARLHKERLPLPAAIGMLFAGASFWGEGDSGHYYAARSGLPVPQVVAFQENPYFKETSPDDPLAFPVRSPDLLARFPPALLMAATRDLGLSSVVQTHSLLVEQSVRTDLHVWEGLDHAFHYLPELPQSRQLYEVVVKFFDKHLNR